MVNPGKRREGKVSIGLPVCCSQSSSVSQSQRDGPLNAAPAPLIWFYLRPLVSTLMIGVHNPPTLPPPPAPTRGEGGFLADCLFSRENCFSLPLLHCPIHNWLKLPSLSLSFYIPLSVLPLLSPSSLSLYCSIRLSISTYISILLDYMD